MPRIRLASTAVALAAGALAIPRAGGDLRPLEIRYRAVRGQRFSGAGAKRHAVTR